MPGKTGYSTETAVASQRADGQIQDTAKRTAEKKQKIKTIPSYYAHVFDTTAAT